MALPINISQLLEGNVVEWERLDFKAGWNPEDVMHSMCAFANDIHNWGGGYIVCGVAETAGRPVLPPVGLELDQMDSIQKKLVELAALVQPTVNYVAQPVTYDGYIRKGSVTCIADADDERRLVALTNKIPFDDRVCHKAEVSDLNKLLIADFLDEVGSELTEDQIVNMSLEELCWTMQIVGGTTEYVKPKNIGILFFSKDPEEYIPGARIEIVRFGKEASDVFEEKILHGPIHKQLEEALSYLENQVIVEKVKKLPGKAPALRAKNYPYEALEEAVCNAVYHKSWDDRNPIEINIYQDRITVYNIEGPVPPLTNEDLQKEHVICRNYRNRRIGDLLKELDLTEGRNTGFPKIYREIRRNGSPLPQFETDERNMHFMVTFPIHPIFLEEDGEIVAKDFPKDCTKELSDRQRIILDLLAEDCTLTSQKISQKISQKEPVTQRTIKMDLADLQRKGLLRREGGRKSGIWVIIEEKKL